MWTYGVGRGDWDKTVAPQDRPAVVEDASTCSRLNSTAHRELGPVAHQRLVGCPAHAIAPTLIRPTRVANSPVPRT